MKFSYSWLKELTKFKHSPQELADLIVLHITEVESISSGAGSYSGVTVAEILEIANHPNADKLHLVTLDVGLGKRATVVCGAKNIEVGQKVPLALVGATLPDGELKPATIRGVESRGMICSAAELGLAKEAEGILVLPKTASVGRPVNEVLDAANDAILDLKILSNRPDYLSYVGLSREIAAVAGIKWSMPLELNFRSTGGSSSDHIGVEVKDEALCPHYRAHFVSNVEVKESPQWLKDKLISSGLRPINNHWHFIIIQNIKRRKITMHQACLVQFFHVFQQHFKKHFWILRNSILQTLSNMLTTHTIHHQNIMKHCNRRWHGNPCLTHL